MLNKVLQEQIDVHFGHSITGELAPLLKSISETYDHLLHASPKNSERAPHSSGSLKEQESDKAEKERLVNHLHFSQKIGLIGSYEADLTPNGHDNVYWSDAVYTILGFKPREIAATFRLFFNAIHADDRLAVIGNLEKLVKMGGSFEKEHRLIAKDGSEKIVLNTVELIVDDQTKQPVKLVGTVQDITEKRKKDKDLLSLNYEMKTLFENVNDVFYSVDMRSYKTIQISIACEKVYGYSVEEFMNDSQLWFNLVVEEDRAIITGNYPALHAGQPVLQQYRIKNKKGAIRWVESRINPTVHNEELIRLDGITTDITERKLTEIALKENELKFRTLIENCSDGIAVMNNNLELSYASTSMSRLSGFPLEEMLGKHIFYFLHPEELGWAENIAQTLMNTPGIPLPLKGRFLKKDEGYFFYEGHISNLVHDPVIGGFVCNFHDVTERQKAEDALTASNIELQKTNKELDRFVYSVSHDLRAPLASISGLIELAETETEEPLMLQDLSLMKSSALKLDGFIVDILNYSRNARLELKAEVVDFSELLDDMQKNLKHMGSKNSPVDIRISLKIDHPFYSDASRLNIIINNLVSNSIRYYNPSVADPFVQVSVETNALHATLIIKDNGVGIDQKFHEKIFDMFYRLARNSDGSGLGLYIVKETVEKLHGSFHLHSQPGEGTQFTIQIPNNNQR
jgi:PAS domain S-box-containing protein